MPVMPSIVIGARASLTLKWLNVHAASLFTVASASLMLIHLLLAIGHALAHTTISATQQQIRLLVLILIFNCFCFCFIVNAAAAVIAVLISVLLSSFLRSLFLLHALLFCFVLFCFSLYLSLSLNYIVVCVFFSRFFHNWASDILRFCFYRLSFRTECGGGGGGVRSEPIVWVCKKERNKEEISNKQGETTTLNISNLALETNKKFSSCCSSSSSSSFECVVAVSWNSASKAQAAATATAACKSVEQIAVRLLQVPWIFLKIYIYKES